MTYTCDCPCHWDGDVQANIGYRCSMCEGGCPQPDATPHEITYVPAIAWFMALGSAFLAATKFPTGSILMAVGSLFIVLLDGWEGLITYLEREGYIRARHLPKR